MSSVHTGESDSNVTRSFKTLYIPADDTKTIEEWDIKYNNATEVSCLIDRLKAHFTSRGCEGDEQKAALRENVRQQLIETMKKQNSPHADKPIDDAMIDMILQMSAVDCVPLQNNKFSTGFIGLMMYVDDQGKSKGLPVNNRATRVTFECGIPTQVVGDVVIARNFDDENNFRRMDFTLKEFVEETQWKSDAMKANKEKSANGDKTKELQNLLSKTQSLGTQVVSQAAALQTKSCSFAGCELDGTLRCSRCKRSWYCSQACQKRDWKFHKANVCITPAPVASSSSTSEAAKAE